jgi:hypothetical protein
VAGEQLEARLEGAMLVAGGAVDHRHLVDPAGRQGPRRVEGEHAAAAHRAEQLPTG